MTTPLTNHAEILALADRLDRAGFKLTAATLRHLLEELNDKTNRNT